MTVIGNKETRCVATDDDRQFNVRRDESSRWLRLSNCRQQAQQRQGNSDILHHSVSYPCHLLLQVCSYTSSGSDCLMHYSTFLDKMYMPSVLWRCWLGIRKGTQPVKNWVVRYWHGYVWSNVQMICIWPSWCHCHPIISCSSKIQNGLPFWYWLTQVFLEKRLLNGCSSWHNVVANILLITYLQKLRYGDSTDNTAEEKSSLFP